MKQKQKETKNKMKERTKCNKEQNETMNKMKQRTK